MKSILILIPVLLFLMISEPSQGVIEVGNNATDYKYENTNSLISSDDVIFMNSEGEEISLSSFKGKVIFINFWATWCLPCRLEMPSINKLKKHFKNNDRIVFMMVDIDGDFAKSLKYMKKKKFDLTVYAPKSPIPENFVRNAIPSTVILNKEGQIAIHTEGAVDYSRPAVRKVIERLVN